MTTIKIELCGGMMPTLATPRAAAYDLYVPEDVILKKGRQVIPLGFCMELPKGYRGIITGRSGFTCKGVEVKAYFFGDDRWLELSAGSSRIDADVLMGVIDDDYRDTVGVLFKVNEDYDESSLRYVIPKGTRIAQMLIDEKPETEMVIVEALDRSVDRGGGYGHTGSK